LRLNDEVNGRCAELILFLLRIKRLLLQFAGLAGGIDLGAVLSERDVGIADVEQGAVFQQLQLCFELMLEKDRALIVRLRGAIADRNLHVQRYLVVGEIVVKDRAHGVAKAGLRYTGNGPCRRGNENVYGIAVRIDQLQSRSRYRCPQCGLISRESNCAVLSGERGRR